MIDSFYIGAYWKQRKESLDIVVKKTTSFLERLTRLDEQFLKWYEQGYRKEIILDKENIEALYRKRVKRNDLTSDGFSKIGYSVSMWSGGEEEYSSNLSINCGHSSKFFSNNCVITMPTEGEKKESLLKLAKQRELVDLLVKSWDPDNIILSSNRLKSEIETDEVGWITYYKLIKQVPKTNGNVVYEKYNDGHLFYLANDKSYDYNWAKELLMLKKIIG